MQASLVGRACALIWPTHPQALPPVRRWALRTVQGAYLILRDLTAGELGLRAAGLVYTTLLSLVPLLAVSFSVLKGFGVHNQLEPFLLELVQPLGEKGPELTRVLIGFVDQMNVRMLGALGSGMLLYTVISLVRQIEVAFNTAWRVDRPRPLARRFTDYLSVVLVGPLLLFSALGASASLLRSEAMQSLAEVGGIAPTVELATRLVPYGLVVAAFTFAYAFLPNTRVRLPSALTGALVAGLLWQSAGWAFARFVVDSGQYTAIYSGFAIVLLFMVWLYVAWLILLAGSSVAFYHQHPGYLRADAGRPALGPRAREQLALAVMTLIGRGHCGREAPATAEGLARELGLPIAPVNETLCALERNGFLARTAEDPPRWLFTRALEAIPLRAVLEAARGPGAAAGETLPAGPLQDVLAAVESALDHTLAGRTVRDLMERGDERSCTHTTVATG